MLTKQKFQECIDACNDCASFCDQCATACLKENEVSNMTKCIELDMYCAEICRAASSFMSKGDKFAKEICIICADICDNCAEECGRHDHQHCQDCAEACRRCATACRQMAA